MPNNKKSQRKENFPDWDNGETGDGYTNGQTHNTTNPADLVGASEHGDSGVNDQTKEQAASGRSNEGRENNSPQPKRRATLGRWTQAVGETLDSLAETKETIENLRKEFALHANDLMMIEDTTRRLQESEEACRGKDEEISHLEAAIKAVNKMESKAKDQSKHDAAKLEEKKFLLKQEMENWEQEKEKQEKRSHTAAAEEKIKIEKEIEKREQELMAEYTRKQDENDGRVKIFEAEKAQLSAAVNKRDKQITVCTEKLEKLKERHEILELAMKRIRTEKRELEAQLEALKKEFTLDAQPIEEFGPKFAEIEKQIEGIAGKYFHGIEEKDPEKVHNDLAKADPIFESVPIEEDSDVSRDLCTAHAQRVISKAICDDIWRPFSSEFTVVQPQFNDFLGKVSEEIYQSDNGGDAARFWNARTVQALNSLPANSVTSPSSESTGYPHPARTDSVVSKVRDLSPLVSSSEEKSLQIDLVNLVNSAVDVWKNVQACGSKITVNLSLGPAERSAWRCKFDPAEPTETNPDPNSPTRTRIFPLFPQILTPGPGRPVNDPSSPPGSWPAEFESAPKIIHHGKGLPEWSQLVISGQSDQEQIEQDRKTAYEQFKKKLHNSRRLSGISRRDSRGMVTPGTADDLSRREGVVNSTEK